MFVELDRAAEVGSDAVEKDQGGADTKPGEEAGTEATSAEQVAQKAVEEDAVEAARRRRAERFGVPYEPLRKALTVKEPQKVQFCFWKIARFGNISLPASTHYASTLHGVNVYTFDSLIQSFSASHLHIPPTMSPSSL